MATWAPGCCSSISSAKISASSGYGDERRADHPRVVGVAPRRRAGGGEDVRHAQLVERVADGEVVGRAHHAEHREGAVAVGADHLVDVGRGLGRVVLVVLVVVLDRDGLAAEVDAALGVDLVEVRLPAAGDLGERRGQARLRVARHQLDGVAHLLGGIAHAVGRVDARLAGGGIFLAAAVGAGIVVVAGAAGRPQQRQRHERGDHLGRRSSQHVPSCRLLSSGEDWVRLPGRAVTPGQPGRPAVRGRRPVRARLCRRRRAGGCSCGRGGRAAGARRRPRPRAGRRR